MKLEKVQKRLTIVIDDDELTHYINSLSLAVFESEHIEHKKVLDNLLSNFRNIQNEARGY